MAKLRDIAKGTRAIKAVPFRLASAPLLPPGVETDEHTIMVGLRVLSPGEIADVYQKAMEAAALAGVSQWLDTHPLCRLHEMFHTVALACVDVDSGERAEPFFVGGVEEIRTSVDLTGDSIAFLYAQHQLWQDECSGPRGAAKTPGELVAMVAEEAARPENARDVPFSRLRPSAQLSCFHSICVLLWSSLTAKSPSTSTPSSSSTSEPLPSEPLPKPSPAAAKATRKKRRR
jgi:hypothetical protein